MPTYYADGVPNPSTIPPNVATDSVNANVRVKYFTHTVATGGYAAAADVALCTLDIGDVPLGGALKVSAIATGGILQLGKSGSVSAYAVDGSANALEVIPFATVALGYGVAMTARTTLLLTFKTGTAGMAAGATIKGHVVYVKAA